LFVYLLVDVFAPFVHLVVRRCDGQVLLDKVSGYCLPGTMTALMGASGTLQCPLPAPIYALRLLASKPA
jgi:hypothetical protein